VLGIGVLGQKKVHPEAAAAAAVVVVVVVVTVTVGVVS
jgi:hypothetical protein